MDLHTVDIDLRSQPRWGLVHSAMAPMSYLRAVFPGVLIRTRSEGYAPFCGP
jgi:hypothetical protein